MGFLAPLFGAASGAATAGGAASTVGALGAAAAPGASALTSLGAAIPATVAAPLTTLATAAPTALGKIAGVVGQATGLSNVGQLIGKGVPMEDRITAGLKLGMGGSVPPAVAPSPVPIPRAANTFAPRRLLANPELDLIDRLLAGGGI